MRSYDSRREPPPEFNCTIWQAGRATSATGLAFKPITVGQSVFIDEGAGQYNPAPFALDEACQNEWPGREVGVFVSVGTGKRPNGSDSTQHLWYEGFMGEFAEARRRLIAKIEGCETTHQYMLQDHLAMRGVNAENYCRLNVEIGVGEFSMNEWYRLAEISTSTRRYLGRLEVQKLNNTAAAKLAKIHRAKLRWEQHDQRIADANSAVGSNASSYKSFANVPDDYPLAVELPGSQPSMLPPGLRNAAVRNSIDSAQRETLEVPSASTTPPRLSAELASSPPPARAPPRPPSSSDQQSSISSKRLSQPDPDRFISHAPTPGEYRTAGGADKIAIMSLDEFPKHITPPQPIRVEPPPLPPKTPLPDGEGSINGGPAVRMGRGTGRVSAPLPYPLHDGPPPPVDRGRKPEYRGL